VTGYLLLRVRARAREENEPEGPEGSMLKTTNLSEGSWIGGGGFAPGGPLEILVTEEDIDTARTLLASS
jgi:hypothetical protein